MPDRTKRSRIGVHAVIFAPGRKTVDRGHFRTYVRLHCIAAFGALSSSEVRTAAAMKQKAVAGNVQQADGSGDDASMQRRQAKVASGEAAACKFGCLEGLLQGAATTSDEAKERCRGGRQRAGF